MAIRFRRPKASGFGNASQAKSPKNKWQPIALPDGLVSGIFNRFAQSQSSSLREIYMSSQVATPLCQADVDSALAMMAALVAQEVAMNLTREKDCLAEMTQLLEELDLSRD